MSDPDSWFGFAAFLAMLLIGSASWIMHRKLRTKASFAFCCTAVVFIIWFALLSPLLEKWIIHAVVVQSDKTLLNAVYIAHSVVLPALLLLAVSTSFFTLARSIKPAA